ncbi:MULTISPECIES: hypothetical protein [unclassified Methylobacterium]|uniref:hypothetical protein n=1 Tax=unclassified Methylobacterium TaxID=2615210 RepID=UPI0012377EF0|nr:MULTISPECIES: hypothetical protein [Methylobacterium]WFT80370.1 hypothetical protein QA634_00140 [Methylobacterium nodulans]
MDGDDGWDWAARWRLDRGRRAVLIDDAYRDRQVCSVQLDTSGKRLVPDGCGFSGTFEFDEGMSAVSFAE